MEHILTKEAEAFLQHLHRTFNARRLKLLKMRDIRQQALNAGEMPDFLEETKAIRQDPTWRVVDAPSTLQKRYVEITGPCEKKMMINAMNSGADTFMADFEDALSPTWENVIQGQKNMCEAVRATLSYTSPEGKHYTLGAKCAQLIVRPRGWHLEEKHFVVDEEPISASLFDFGLYFYHNAKVYPPYFYLPKLESHLEAALWRDVFIEAERWLGLAKSTIRATVLIETILAAFEMEEILYELKDYVVGLNAGRWDYIFSIIKKFQNNQALLLPDRAQITMTVPFMRAYTNLLIKTCHKRGAHAMGGMAAFVPSRKNPEINAQAVQKVTEDKVRESQDGFDGTWVAHPDLVPVAKEVFASYLQGRPNQKERLREDVVVSAKELIDFHVPQGTITEQSIRQNVSVSLQYINAWLHGTGAVAINNLMEDAATAEICRSQLWQWLHHKDGPLTQEQFIAILHEESAKIGLQNTAEACKLLQALVSSQRFIDFLTNYCI